MKQIFFSTIILLSFASQLIMAEECVILLHELARTERSMNKMETALKKENFEVVNYYYPSRKYKVGRHERPFGDQRFTSFSNDK